MFFYNDLEYPIELGSGDSGKPFLPNFAGVRHRIETAPALGRRSQSLYREHPIRAAGPRPAIQKKSPGVSGAQTATGLSTDRRLLCAIVRQRRVTVTLPRFDGAVERGARQPEGHFQTSRFARNLENRGMIFPLSRRRTRRSLALADLTAPRGHSGTAH